MKSVFAPVVAALLFAARAAAQLTINTPLSVVVCQPLLISWTGGTPPYFLSVLPGNQPTAAALLDFGQQTGNSLTWTVNVTAGTSLGLDLRDSTGALAQSAAFTVQSSSNTACLTGTASGGSTPTTGTTTGVAATTAATTPVTTPVTTPLTTAATSKPATTTHATGSATSPAASASASKAAALRNAVGGQAGGIVVGVGAALLALLA